MPKQVELRVIVGQKGAAGPFIGDVITINNTSGKILEIRPKDRWCHFIINRDGRDVLRKLPMDSEVNVTREVPTDDEEAADRMADFTRRVADRQARALVAQTSAWNDLHKTYSHNRAEGYLAAFSMERAAHLYSRVVVADIWRSVKDKAQWWMDQGVNVDVATLRAVRGMIMLLTAEVMAAHSDDPLSRSTSTMSNLERDMKRYQQRGWIAQWEYDDLDGLAALADPTGPSQQR